MYRKVFSSRLPIEIGEELVGGIQSPINRDRFRREDREKTWERASNGLPVGTTFFIRFDTTTQNRIYLLLD